MLFVAAAVAWGDDDKPAILTVDDTFAGALDAATLRDFMERVGAEVDAQRIAQVLVASAHSAEVPAGWLDVKVGGAESVAQAAADAAATAAVEAASKTPKRRRKRAAVDTPPPVLPGQMSFPAGDDGAGTRAISEETAP